MNKDFSEFREQYLTVDRLAEQIRKLPGNNKVVDISELPAELLRMSHLLTISLLEDYHNWLYQQDD